MTKAARVLMADAISFLKLAYVSETMLAANLAYMALVPYRYKERIFKQTFDATDKLLKYIETIADATARKRMESHVAWEKIEGLVSDTHVPDKFVGSYFPKTAWLRESWGGWYRCIFYRMHLRQYDIVIAGLLAFVAGALVLAATYFDVACSLEATDIKSHMGCGWPRDFAQFVLLRYPFCVIGGIGIGCAIPITFVIRGRAACNRADKIFRAAEQQIMGVPEEAAKEQVRKKLRGNHYDRHGR